MILDLAHNVALLVALAVCSQMLVRRLKRPLLKGLVDGILFGLVGIIGMMTPVHFATGVISDGRSIVLSLAGLFGGPLAAVVSGGLCVAYRLHVGGAGALAGVLVIVEAVALGTVLHRLRRRDEVWISPGRLWLFGVLVHGIMMAAQLVIPEVGWQALLEVGPPVVLVYPLGFLLTALLFLGFEQRRKMEASLREREVLYRALFDLSPVGVVIFDTETAEPLEFNQQVCRQLGYSAQEFARLSLSDIETGSSDSESLKRIHQAARDGGGRFEAKHRTKEGAILDVQVTVQATRLGERDVYHCAWQDVTAQTAAEQALRDSNSRLAAVLGALPDPMFEIDGAGRLLDAHAQDPSQLYVQDFLGKTVAEVLPAEAAASALEGLEMAKRHGRHVGATYALDMHNERRWFELSIASKQQSGEEDHSRFIVLTRDITSRKRSEEERLALERQLQHSQKMESLGVLAGGVAHDFNNMLAAMTGSAELALAATTDGTEVQHHLQRLMVAATRASSLVNQILTFARRADSEKRLLRLETLLDETVGLLKSMLPSTVHLQVFIEPNLPPVLADPTQLQQVIMNLCTNAHQSMPDGGELRIRLAMRDVDGAESEGQPDVAPCSYVCLDVSDTGIGMTDETLERIFEPFFTTQEVGRGTGMGLATSHGIVTGHGGFMTVASSPGAGSVFTVHLPPAVGDVQDVPPVQPATATGRHERILVIDDEQLVLTVTTTMLRKLDYDVTPFSSSLDALTAIEASPDAWDLVLTDQTMPDLDGRQLVQQIRTVCSALPIVIMSGHSERLSLDEEDGGIGVDAVLRKPFRLPTLAATLRRILDERHSVPPARL